MEQVKKVGDNTIYKKRSGRYGVQNKQRKWINGEAKQTILVDAGLITMAKKQAVAEPVAEEAAAEEAPVEAEGTTDA